MRVYRDKSKWVWLLLVLFLAMGCGKEKQQSPIVVKVGDEKLTLDELAMSIPEELRDDITHDEIQEYISRWINSHILYQVGMKIGLGNDPVIRKRVHDIEVAIVGNA